MPVETDCGLRYALLAIVFCVWKCLKFYIGQEADETSVLVLHDHLGLGVLGRVGAVVDVG